jgi:hypothetical protein
MTVGAWRSAGVRPLRRRVADHAERSTSTPLLRVPTVAKQTYRTGRLASPEGERSLDAQRASMTNEPRFEMLDRE